MSPNRKAGEVVAYLLATVAGILLLPVVAPAIIWTNTRGYSDEHSSMPSIPFENAFVSSLTAFACVVVFATPIHGIDFDGWTVLDSPLTRVDGDGLIAGSAPEPTPTPTEALTLPPIGEENKNTDLSNETQNYE